MFFKLNTALILAAMAFVQVHASPAVPRAEGELVLLSSQETPTGTIDVWGYPEDASKREPEAASVPVKKCCGTNNVTCSGSHQADRNSCNQLVQSLNANGGQGVGSK
ncbi:hypothetical protein FB45DRAFT_757666 [Roridomyces roridus]|uniref:Hydrophobin n=1 Tax=Roridomyces roridus TaxID=1738132 RepID=A0AAD7BAY1_9AGAR|nr:hypothetical protein FB45DRAFT_757666 [Roridomyces roridus]